MDPAIDETIKKIQNMVTEQTGNCSKIARQIAFGLTAATWALLFIEDSLHYNIFLLLALLSEIVYFILDFMQYFLLSFNYKGLFINIKKVLSKRGGDISDEILQTSIQEAQKKANNQSYLFFYLKFPFIALAFIMVLVFVLTKI
jgi:hypothetical protein